MKRRTILATLIGAGLMTARADSDGARALPPAGPERAAALVAAYARSVGVPDRRLDGDGDVSFGESGFHYDAGADVLIGRIYVNNALLDGAPPEELANYRRMAVILNDPSVGGMYDRGGGSFVLDERRQAYFLVRRFTVPDTRSAELVAAMDQMKRIAPAWTTTWLFEVAMILHGHRAKRAARVKST